MAWIEFTSERTPVLVNTDAIVSGESTGPGKCRLLMHGNSGRDGSIDPYVFTIQLSYRIVLDMLAETGLAVKRLPVG